MKKEERKGFCMFYDWVDDLNWLEGADAWAIVQALCRYYREGIPPMDSVDGHLRATAALIFHQIKRQEAVSLQRAENAKATNEKRKKGNLRTQCERNADEVRSQCHATDTGTYTDTGTNTDTDTFTGTEYREEGETEGIVAPPQETPSPCAPRLTKEDFAKLVWEGVDEAEAVSIQSG